MKLFVTLATLVGFATAACPNSCSGHGTCDQYDACTCFKEAAVTTGGGAQRFKGTNEYEWTGADCSRRTCPRGISWTKTNTNTDVASGATLNVQSINWKILTDNVLELAGPFQMTFNWHENSKHDVHRFENKEDFEKCTFTGSKGKVVEIGRPSDITKPYNTATFDSTTAAATGGSYFFASKDNCGSKQKLEIKLVSATAKALAWKKDVGTATPSTTLQGAPAVVTFTFTGAINVALFPTEKDWTDCTIGKASVIGTKSPFVWKQDVVGTYYFASTNANDCKNDKVKTQVKIIQAFTPDVAVDGENRQCNHHPERECSDQGLCDRATGLCSCFAGYTGSSCQRTTCPDDCSGHGTCRSNRDFAYDWAIAKTTQMHKKNIEDHTELFKEIYFASYDEAWDSDKHWGCKCDTGYRGPSCALVECPSYADPLDDKCEMASESVSVITNFQLQYDAPFGAAGWEDAYSKESGPAGDGKEQATLDNSDYNRHYIIDNNGRKVYGCYGSMSGQDCSGRGICDYSSGTSKCFSGYSGTACEKVKDRS